MSFVNAKKAWKEQLWNVSLFPAPALSLVAPANQPGPFSGGSSARTPSLLSVSEDAPALAEAEAA
jgi:hypothetical protein